MRDLALRGLAAASHEPSLTHTLSIVADTLVDAMEEPLELLQEADEVRRRETEAD